MSISSNGFKADVEAFKSHLARHNEQKSCACDDDAILDPMKMDVREEWPPFITIDEHAARLLAGLDAQYERRKRKIVNLWKHTCNEEPATKANACSVCGADRARVGQD